MEMSGQLYTPAVWSPEMTPVTHWIGGSLGFRAGLDEAMKKIPTPDCSGNAVVQPLAWLLQFYSANNAGNSLNLG
jgi:hypothetical protein